jgi:hypothetical protein
MKLRIPTLALQIAIVAVAPGAAIFWRFAAWRARLETELNRRRGQ